MQINQKFWECLSPVLSELKQKINCDFVVFGSTPLYLLGVLDFERIENLNDIDIAVGDDFVSSEEMQEVYFHDEPNQKLYKILIQGINVDIGPAWPGREDIYDKIFRDSFEVGGFKFASLNTVREWKELMVKEYGREKDRNHLEKIKDFQKRKAESVIVADATLEDMENVLSLKDEVWVSTYTNKEHGITVEDIQSRKIHNAQRLDFMQKSVRGKSTTEHIWTAKKGGRIVGMCWVERKDGYNKIGSLYLLPSYQRMGIGKRLMEKALSWLGEEKKIKLGVATYNSDAIEFYRKFGFEFLCKGEDYVFPNGKKMPILQMVKYFEVKKQ